MKDQTVLSHHGIKGQKWGVRRTPEQLGHAPRRERKSKIAIKIHKEKSSSKVSDSNVKNPSSKKSVREMSDEDLRRIINRIELERKYASLTAQQKSKGRKIVEGILAESAKKTATKYVSKGMDKAVDELLKKVSNSGGGGHP